MKAGRVETPGPLPCAEATVEPMLTVECAFGYREPLGSISKTFEIGSLYGITGPNGSGKSTLLSTVAGELEPLTGTIRVDYAGAKDGRADSESVDPASKAGAGSVVRIAEPVFYPDLSVAEHLALMSRATGLDPDEVVDEWRLESLLRFPPSRLSSGQRQRFSLATQLMTPGCAFVVDEPERHLDAAWTEYVCGNLVEKAHNGAVVLVASHSPMVLDSCDEVIELG